MSNSTTCNESTNPNAMGGAFGYDGRTGLGIGSLTKHPASGLGSNWSMGDALSSPVGEWDKEIAQDELEDFEEGGSESEFDDFEADIFSKAHMSFHRGATDSLSRKGTSIGYMGGIGSDMSAVIGLSAGKVTNGNVMLENYIREILCEYTIGGNIAVRSRPKAKNTGGEKNRVHYATDTSTSHTNKLDNSRTSKSRATDHKGIGQRAKTPELGPYSKSGKPTTDGGETLGIEKSIEDHENAEEYFNNGYSTFEELVHSDSQIVKDRRQVHYCRNKKHIK